MYIYIHIPKAAGSTLRNVIGPHFRESEKYIVRDDIPGDRKRFESMTDEQKMGIGLLFGHISYGWHNMVPQRCRYMTVLRNPVERVPSLYWYIVRSPGHFLHREVRGMTLLQFIKSGVHAAADNGMVRQLCGQDRYFNSDGGREPYNDSIIPYGHVTRDHFILARNHLIRFWMLGIVDRFDQFVNEWKSKTGFQSNYNKHDNQTPSHQRRELSDDEYAAIIEYNRYDMDLYGIAEARVYETASGFR